MGRIHFSLTTWYNALVIAVSAAVAGALVFLAQPRPLLSSAIGISAGLLAGMLQRKSIQLSPALFAAARSILQIRRAFKSNRAGALSIAMVWATGLVLFVSIALVHGGDSAFGGDNALVEMVAGYAMFMFARDVVAFGAVSEVRRIASQPD